MKGLKIGLQLILIASTASSMVSYADMTSCTGSPTEGSQFCYTTNDQGAIKSTTSTTTSGNTQFSSTHAVPFPPSDDN